MKHNAQLTPFAQKLRREMTREERKLWYDYLNRHPHRFRRQVAFGNFIMDFYCASAKLAVELDGSQHYSEEGLERDAERTAFLNANGIMVLRFSNTDVTKNLRGVCEQIDLVIQQRLQNLSRFATGEPPSPKGRAQARRADGRGP